MVIEANKVYSFKMTWGEEIVAKVTKINTVENYYVVDAPLGLAPTQQGLQLVPTSFAADLNPEGVNIYKHAIAMEFAPRDDLLNVYRESTTGIKVPDKQIITG